LALMACRDMGYAALIYEALPTGSEVPLRSNGDREPRLQW
jgi:hypothetical protein